MVTFFFDHNTSPKLARALALLDRQAKFELLRDWTDRNTKDVDWIPMVAQRRWVIVSGDHFSGPGERELIRRLGVRTYILHEDLRRRRDWPSLLRFLRIWPRIREHAESRYERCLWRVSVRSPYITPVRL